MPVTDRTHPIVRGMLDRDVDAMAATLAPDAVLNSPLTAYPFRGAEQVTHVLAAVAETYVRYELLADWREDSTYVFNGQMWFRGGDVQLLERVELDDEERVREMSIFGRPLSGTALFAAEVGPVLAERMRPGRTKLAVRALGGPLPALLRGGDRAVARLLGIG